MVSVNLINQHVRSVHFTNLLDKPGQFQMTSHFNFQVNYMANNSQCVATLYQSAQLQDDPDKLFISGEIVGVFKLQGVVDEESKREAHVDCYNQLFPFLQSTVAQLAAAGGIPGFMLKKNNMSKENVVIGQNRNRQNNPPASNGDLPWLRDDSNGPEGKRRG